jgi:hypothetical protein
MPCVGSVWEVYEVVAFEGLGVPRQTGVKAVSRETHH